MKCKKMRRLLPLLAGSELPESQIPPVRAHMEGCSRCQAEFEKYTVLVGQTREWLTESKIDWEEQEWQQSLRSAVNQVPQRKTALIPWPFPKTWAYVLVAGAMLLLTLLVVQPPFVKQMGFWSESVDAAEMEEQEVVSMTMVSKETGLKIVWFFNKNFNLEENE